MGTERPFVLALSGALMGLPFVTSIDQYRRSPPDKRRNGKDGDE